MQGDFSGALRFYRENIERCNDALVGAVMDGRLRLLVPSKPAADRQATTLLGTRSAGILSSSALLTG